MKDKESGHGTAAPRDLALRKAARRRALRQGPSLATSARISRAVMSAVKKEEVRRERREEILTWGFLTVLAVGGLAVVGKFCGALFREIAKDSIETFTQTPPSLWLTFSLFSLAFLGLNHLLRTMILGKKRR